jgi:HAD superfamily hydrolase (TIGR01509 family)
MPRDSIESAKRPDGFRPAALLFDMDGLLLDTERLCVELWVEASAVLGWPVDRAVPLACVGLDEAATRAKVLELCGRGYPYDRAMEALRVGFEARRASGGLSLRPGARVILERAASLGLALAVATSTRRASAERSLAAAGIRAYFAAVVGGDEVERSKPAPDIYLAAAARLGVAPALCLGLEDSPAGLASLAAAGVRAVFVKDLVEPPPAALASVWRRCPDLAAAAVLFG